MSILSAIIIKNRKIFFVQGHYRKIMKCFLNSFDCISRNEFLDYYVDGGYIIVDFDRKMIVNGQDCFLINEFDIEGFRILL